MNPFFVLEQWCAGQIERVFARAFPSRLEPVQIARRLVSSLEAVTPPPTRYTVAINPLDHEGLAPDLADLRASWEFMLTEMARHLALPLAGAPVITVSADPAVVPGSVRIDALPGEDVMRLRIVRGIPAGGTVEVRSERPVIIGRAPESDLALFDPSVSRRHAGVRRHGETLEFTDLGSSNGSFSDGRRIERAVLRRGDVIRIGACELRVE